MLITSGLFIVGLALLIKGADWLVEGASSLAGKLGISALVIGLTIVSFGTSAPELVVNILASLNGNTDIAIGNVVGSNIVNILLILGVAAVIRPLIVQESTVWKEIPFALLGAFVLFILANDSLIDGFSTSALTRVDGLILILFFLIFIYYIFSLIKTNLTKDKAIEVVGEKSVSTVKSSLLVVTGIASLVIGGNWIVEGAMVFATSLGVSEVLIGLTIVAIGTSLPELATSAVAAYRGNVDIAVGNVVGSNIFNIFWILGVSSIIQPLPFSSVLTFDLIINIIATILLFSVFFVGKKHMLERWQGILFIILYIIYLAYLIFRG